MGDVDFYFRMQRMVWLVRAPDERGTFVTEFLMGISFSVRVGSMAVVSGTTNIAHE